MKQFNHYIGVTETADAGIFWKYIKNLQEVNILITKHLESTEFRHWLIQNQDRVILHHTITGWGGTPMESGVPTPEDSFMYLKELLKDGFPKRHVVIRIDPIIPNEEGLDRFRKVLLMACTMEDGPNRIRVSVMDCYDHVRNRLDKLGTDLRMYKGFHAASYSFKAVNDIIAEFKSKYPQIYFEACAEPKLTECNHIGCVSKVDCSILGQPDLTEGKQGRQRTSCLCPANKIQLLGGYNKMPKCPSNCKYCYLK